MEKCVEYICWQTTTLYNCPFAEDEPPWAIPFDVHTTHMADIVNLFTIQKCGFHIEQLFCTISVRKMWAIPVDIHTLLVEDINQYNLPSQEVKILNTHVVIH